MINREEKRAAVAKRDTAKRDALKAAVINESLSFTERMAARDKLNKLDRNGAEARGRNRCSFTGRPRGFHRAFGICRNVLRELASKGLLPGVRKASW
jgi:small subunit ribosomal protein S14